MEQPPAQRSYLDVTYYQGITMYGALPARLEIKGDRLVLVTSEGTQEAPIYKEVFNVPLSEVKKVRSMLDEFRVVIGNKAHRMSVAQYATPIMAAGGVAGTAVAAGMYHKSGASAFLALLRDKGVATSRMGYGAILGIATIIAIALIAAIVGVLLLT